MPIKSTKREGGKDRESSERIWEQLVELGKACRREAAARKMGGERCVLILSLTCLWRGEVCEQCRICNKEL